MEACVEALAQVYAAAYVEAVVEALAQACVEAVVEAVVEALAQACVEAEAYAAAFRGLQLLGQNLPVAWARAPAHEAE